MERIPRQFYTQRFKEETDSLIIDDGLTVAEVRRRLSLAGTQTIRLQAGRRAVKGRDRRQPAESGLGSQYCSHSHQKLMKQFKMKPSINRKGNCWDNASMESFFGTFKREMINIVSIAPGRKPWQRLASTLKVF